MRVCCTQEFKDEFDRLKKSKSYASLEAELATQYCNTTFEEARTGTLLSAMPNASFVKKRLEGSGGYRVYVLAVVVDEIIYLGYVHPKTGRHGCDNLTTAEKMVVLEQILATRASGKLYEVTTAFGKPKKLIIVKAEAKIPAN